MRWPRGTSLRIRVALAASAGVAGCLFAAGWLSVRAVRTHTDPELVQQLVQQLGLLAVAAVVAAAGYALWDARTLERVLTQLQRRKAEAEALYRTSREILVTTHPEEALQVVADRARQLLNCGFTAICLDRTEGDHLVWAVSNAPDLHQRGDFPVHVPGDVCKGCSVRHKPGFWLRGTLTRDGREVGAVCAAAPDGRLFSAPDSELLEGYAGLAGLAAERSRLHSQLQALATVTERERLARELHDSVAQNLGYLYSQLRLLESRVRKITPEQAASDLSGLARVASVAFDEVRDSIFSLRAPLPSSRSAPTALAGAGRDFSARTGLPVETNLESLTGAEFSPEVEVQLLRIVQEALANVARHARAGRVRILAEQIGRTAEVTVEDDGIGFIPDDVERDGRRHFGLETMRERAESVGGTLRVESAPQRGTRVRVSVPINP